VGGLLGSSCLIRSSTTGVYGAAASTAGDFVGAGNVTGNEYGGTSADAADGSATSAAIVRVASPRPARANHPSAFRRTRPIPDKGDLSLQCPVKPTGHVDMDSGGGYVYLQRERKPIMKLFRETLI
jgi:hypothetical protein